MAVSKIKGNPSLKNLETQMKVLIPLAKGVILLSKFGIENKSLTRACRNAVEESEKMKNLFDMPDRFNHYFCKLGWIAHESMNLELMTEAVTLAEQDNLNKAEELLVNQFDKSRVDFLCNRMIGNPITRSRIPLMKKYAEDFLDERYHSCIPGVLIIIDGIVSDLNQKAYFSSDSNTESWDSISGHVTGLNELQKVLYKTRRKTTEDALDIPYRNGILHGRDLNFSNKKVASKCLATIAAILDWVHSKKSEEQRKKDNAKHSNISLRDSLRSLNDTNRFKDDLKKWERRNLELGRDIPTHGRPEDFEDNSPERKAAEIMQFISSKNYGKIADSIHSIFEKPKGKMAGGLREMFSELNIREWTFSNIDEQAPAICEITISFLIGEKETPIPKAIRFIYVSLEDESPAIYGVTDGEWKVVEVSMNAIQSLTFE